MHRILMVLLAVTPAAAMAGPHRDAVLDLLNAYEHAPTAGELNAIGDRIDLELMEIAGDASVPSSRRGRAVTALGLYPSEAVRSFLDARLQSSEPSILRRKATYALVEGFGAAAVPAVTQALSDSDVQVRLAAVSALRTVGDAAATDALRTRLASETDATVRAEIETSLAGGR